MTNKLKQLRMEKGYKLKDMFTVLGFTFISGYSEFERRNPNGENIRKYQAEALAQHFGMTVEEFYAYLEN